MRKLGILVLVLSALAGARLSAQAGRLVVAADPQLIESGFTAFVFPRFALKTGIAVSVHAIGPGNDAASVRIVAGSGQGLAVFEGFGRIYSLVMAEDAPAQATRFAAWMRSGVGGRTIAQFRLDGKQVFKPIEQALAAIQPTVFKGNAARGERLAYANCGRCHVIGARNRMKGIGSTPSFGALRALKDWQERFQTFYVRNPHPAVVQVADITMPFSAARPTPMHPVEITQDELHDILAFVAALEPADLGAPIRHQ
ncbi:MAG: c-type cytochrome [Paracoccaceae bacterium]|nr:c-type cytochrome [Paracoccaceae bacterium]